MKKIKQTYFSHDSNARNDFKLIKLRAHLGYEGYGIYFALIELLFSEDNKLCINDYQTLAFGLQCDHKKLKSVIEDFDLFVIEDNCFYSARLNIVIDGIKSKSQTASENAKKRWNNATAMQSQSESNAIKLNKIKVNKIKSNKTIEKRLTEFSNSVTSNNLDIDKKDKIAFIEYWSEPNKSKTKMRFEMEKTWDLNRRLKRWSNNGFNKQKSRFPDYYDELLIKRMDESSKKEYENHLKSLGYVTQYNPNAGAKWIKK